ncbi:uncharacterized protein VTP21DRAFT_5876 [Calcarisporiella thermophila]|uniref:uncharacterized protein n=1 Tax=Calcarisporiella thermophila TaxID=911321 RepID=UPI0037431DBC
MTVGSLDFRVSDLFRRSSPFSASNKGKGKGKSRASSAGDSLATRLLEGQQAMEGEWENELARFRELLALNKTDSIPVFENESEVEFGNDIAFQPPYWLEAISDTESSDSEMPGDESIYPFPVDDSHTSTQARTKEEKFGRNWLLGQCEKHLALQGNVDIPPTRLCTDLFTILRSERADDEIQMELVDILGYDNFEFITSLLGNRQTIIDNIVSSANGQQEISTIPAQKPAPSQLTQRSTITPQVIIRSEEEMQELKKIRKDEKRLQRQFAKGGDEEEAALSSTLLGFDGAYLKRAREDALRVASEAPLASGNVRASHPAEVYPNVYQSAKVSGPLSMFGTRFVLPEGTTREDSRDYEEITIPVVPQAPVRTHERRIFIHQMDNLCKGSFKGYKSLNRVQSIVYPIAYETNENMLICAPTGAGKTDVAMLTILRCLYNYCNPKPIVDDEPQSFSIAKRDFKIVYVAPMKALAAEVVGKLGSRLKWLGIEVRELTGDMQLTRTEIQNTQIIVTTPEKWDVVTRKGTGDVELAQKVKLLIIDEVHLLHEDRGAVIESIIARTLRQVETSQSMIRIVGLSATLPNYLDVAMFLRVNPHQGLFYFDSGFRPVPLEQHFIGVKGKPGSTLSNDNMNRACYDKIQSLVREGHQVMVFVHARKETVKTAKKLREMAVQEGEADMFLPTEHPKFEFYKKEIARSRNREMKELFAQGFGIHHAGMLRSDRTLTEKMFEAGLIKVLCCTATLAWGVNLPAYAVVIKGTQVYDTQKGNFVDLSILDVLQIFGRAGRPQYESQGVGYIITTHDKLSHYISAITQQHPIESTFISNMVDNLNAEISLGTVTNVDEAVTWLSYTYLFVRMKRNPMVYGMDHFEPSQDPLLGRKRRELVVNAARTLHRTQMIIFDENTGYLTAKDLGRIASNFYISHRSIEIFNSMMRPRMTEADALAMISLSSEFDQIKSRDNEQVELKDLQEGGCFCEIKGGPDSTHGKVNILLQTFISRMQPEDFALVSDSSYVAQNASRIIRALFEIALNRNWGPVTSVLLNMSKSIDKRMWPFEHPLGQFGLPADIIQKLEAHDPPPTIEQMRDMTPAELGQLVRHNRMGPTIAKCVDQFPLLALDAQIAPITRNVLRVQLNVVPDFVWNDRIHGSADPWWIWVEDAENTEIYYSEYLVLNKKHLGETQKLSFTIPVTEPLPPQIFVRATSDRWIGAETIIPISFKHLILPEHHQPHTDLLDLQPLPIAALHDEVLEDIYAKRFKHFNPIQTQIFHTLYHTDLNTLVGAPTGSGKTVAAELAMWWAFRKRPGTKVVYIAPLKALVRERVIDWRTRLVGPTQKKLVELTGDVTPDLHSIETADIIITTPEKWDGISRNWQHRTYVQKVSCVIIDEIHLLGGDRGPTLEMIVSRMNYMGAQTDQRIRIIGLSTALANAHDLANWLGITPQGLFNFRHSVRPVPLEIYIDGFPGKHYCPRMAMMNKPTFAAIKTHSPTQPVIVFVSSRRQTRLTAQDLIALCGLEENPRRFLRLSEDELEMVLAQVQDQSLKNSLQFGIGLHHAGLTDRDRGIVEELFVNTKIQVLIATSTLAWGVNFPAHLVVIKGTEFYDAKSKGYVDFPITDVLQMMGRAGRPQFDTTGIARIFVHDSKKNFYKKFLHEPFPVESSLHLQLDNHLNAEITSGTVRTTQDAMQFVTWTYFFRRLQQNPSYYGLTEMTPAGVNSFLSRLIEQSLRELALSGCVQIEEEGLVSTPLGRIASFYYLHHASIRLFRERFTAWGRDGASFLKILEVLACASEFAELPVRHNEDILNRELEKDVRAPVPQGLTHDSPHAKAFLLLQAHLGRVRLPVADYITDTTSVLDQSVRVLQAMIDVAAELGLLNTSLIAMNVLQCIKQGQWEDSSSLMTIPHIDSSIIQSGALMQKGKQIRCLAEFALLPKVEIDSVLAKFGINPRQEENIRRMLANVPIPEVSWRLGWVKDKSKKEKEPLRIGARCALRVQLRLRRRPMGGEEFIHAPRFPKPQRESWWVVLGDTVADEIVALRRVAPFSANAADKTSNAGEEKWKRAWEEMTTSLRFTVPDGNLEGKVRWVLFLISDGYLGIDQQVPVEFDVGE